MSKSIQGSTITIEYLNKELDVLKKKLFIYETLNAEKDIENNRIKGPFKSGKDILNHIRH